MIFYISYSERDGYQYTVSGTTLKRFLADIYDHKSTDDLKYNKTLGYNEAEATPEQVMEYLSSDKRYGISDKYSAYNRYRILVPRYAIAQNSYQKFVLTVLATGVSDETVAWVSENSDTPQECLSMKRLSVNIMIVNILHISLAIPDRFP